jgi:uncharacterized membrane protein YeiB
MGERFSRALRIGAMWGALLSVGVQSILILAFFYHWGFDPLKEVSQSHFLATVGLTGFASVSFAVVVFLRNTEGPVEFDVWGLRFRGAAGQVVLWAFCVIVLSACAKTLW